jgi:hypothetical protein
VHPQGAGGAPASPRAARAAGERAPAAAMPRPARQHTPPRVTAAVLTRLYPQPVSLEDAVQWIAGGAAPAAAGGGGAAGPLQLVQPGDPRSFTHAFLRRTLVAVPPDAPRPAGQQPRLSQRSTQEQARAPRRAAARRACRAWCLAAACRCGFKQH